MTYLCLCCDNVFGEGDMEQLNGFPRCPECHSPDVVMSQLEVDNFEVDVITLRQAVGGSLIPKLTTDKARWKIVEKVLDNLTAESKREWEVT